MTRQVPGDPQDFPRDGALSRETTALMIIDMQHDFCSVGGYMDRLGVALAGLRPPIAPIGPVLAAARAARYRIVHTREAYRPALAHVQPRNPHRGIATGAAG